MGSSIVKALAAQLSAHIDITTAGTGTKVSVVHSEVPVMACQSAARAV